MLPSTKEKSNFGLWRLSKHQAWTKKSLNFPKTKLSWIYVGVCILIFELYIQTDQKSVCL